MHELLREQSLAAWSAMANGQPNPLVESLVASAELNTYLKPELIRELLDASAYTGDAPVRARLFASHIRETLAKD
jgi:adenylosuccinate lyase